MSAKRTDSVGLMLALLVAGAACALFLPGSAYSLGTATSEPYLAAGVVVAAGPESAQTPAKGGPQQTCPVTGGKIDKSVYVDYQGKRIYFCCAACQPTFLKDPDKYIKEMEAKGVVLEPSPPAATKPAPE